MWAVIAGGGTAGHVSPALSIAQALVSKGCPAEEIHFIGSRRGLETELVPAAGFSLTALPGRGLLRKMSLNNIGALFGLVIAFIRATLLLITNRPAVVVSVGGYAAAPAVLAAGILRIPLILAESNAFPGAANRLGARFAVASAVAFPNTALPGAVVTGNPLRLEIAALKRDHESRKKARQLLELPEDRLVLAVFGGSLGSLQINGATIELVEAWSDREDVAIHHVLGSRDWQSLKEKLALLAPEKLIYQPVEYQYDIGSVYLAADLVVCRAGATTVAELASVGMPAILVPLPKAPGDHQTLNARQLEEVGAAVIIPDEKMNADRLNKEITSIISQPDRLKKMSNAAKQLAQPDAANKVAELIQKHARKSWIRN